jgi:hypothetical protein
LLNKLFSEHPRAMSKAKPATKAAAKKTAAPIKDLPTKKDPKGGPSAKSKRIVVLQSS